MTAVARESDLDHTRAPSELGAVGGHELVARCPSSFTLHLMVVVMGVLSTLADACGPFNSFFNHLTAWLLFCWSVGLTLLPTWERRASYHPPQNF